MAKLNGFKLFGENIAPGESKTIYLEIAKLHTTTKLSIPIIVERAEEPGPVILITAGIHGDEINGIDIVRQLVAQKINCPLQGTIVCIPIVNVFGFVNRSRAFPDGRDLNRVFPGSKNGSLASRFAYEIMTEILPKVDYCLDFHTGGAQRFNAPQIRIEFENTTLFELAKVFNAPFTVHSKNLAKTFRNSCDKLGKPMLLFEGGKSDDINKEVSRDAIEGIKRVLNHLGVLCTRVKANPASQHSVFVNETQWIRAKVSGLFHNEIEIGQKVKKGTVLANITDPYGSISKKIKAPVEGYVININHSPIVYQGDAIYHLATHWQT
ncbi:MAG: succinylglutamate desuccinylase/aspartoacylase family protein [Flavobacteriaceae bacterium]|nr:succinylglutamate desuccinylase/aspartoacylase family protein [Flavobacteriaceae bacterium]